MSRNGNKGKRVEKTIAAREKYVAGWNRTMVQIWKEKILALDVIDTGTLYNSVCNLLSRMDGRFYEIALSQQFQAWGLWSNYGTGKEVYRGNPGDIGRPKVRKKKKWFSPKYYGSVMAIKEFMSQSLGSEFKGIISDVFDQDKLRLRVWP